MAHRDRARPSVSVLSRAWCLRLFPTRLPLLSRLFLCDLSARAHDYPTVSSATATDCACLASRPHHLRRRLCHSIAALSARSCRSSAATLPRHPAQELSGANSRLRLLVQQRPPSSLCEQATACRSCAWPGATAVLFLSLHAVLRVISLAIHLILI